MYGCEVDESQPCAHSATIKKIEVDGGCLYFYFEADDGELLYPDDNVIEDLDSALNMDLSEGKQVRLDYFEPDSALYLECLIQLAPGTHIRLTCLSQGLETVFLDHAGP